MKQIQQTKPAPVAATVAPVVTEGPAQARPEVSDITSKIDAALAMAQAQKRKVQHLVCHACCRIGCGVDPHWHDEDEEVPRSGMTAKQHYEISKQAGYEVDSPRVKREVDADAKSGTRGYA